MLVLVIATWCLRSVMQTAHLLFWWTAIALLLNLPSRSQNNKPPILKRIVLAICTALVPVAMFILDMYTWFYYAYEVWHDMTAFSIGYSQGQIDFGGFEYRVSEQFTPLFVITCGVRYGVMFCGVHRVGLISSGSLQQD